jgi:hypothetical protein
MVNAVSVYSFRSTTAASYVIGEEPNILVVPNTFELKAYPNPVKSNKGIRIGLRTPKSKETVNVSLYDALGKMIYYKILVTDDNGIANSEIIANFQRGLYFLKAQSLAGDRRQLKLIVD